MPGVHAEGTERRGEMQRTEDELWRRNRKIKTGEELEHTERQLKREADERKCVFFHKGERKEKRKEA